MTGSALFEGYGWGWGFDFACVLVVFVTVCLGVSLRARAQSRRVARIKFRDEGRPVQSAVASTMTFEPRA